MIELVKEVGVELISADASDDMVAMAAWVSNDMDSAEKLKDRGRVAGLINFLYRNEHMSPFEHGRFTFKVDVPLFVAREIQRHRAASYNEVSGRYTEMKPRFYSGTEARVQKGKMGNYHFESGSVEQTARYLNTKRIAAEADWVTYQDRIASGIAKEQAREELPLSLMTQFYVTMNPRNLMHFLALRTDTHALKEIRDVAVKMEEVFAQTMPLTYEAYVNHKPEDVSELKEKIAILELENRRLKHKVETSEARAEGLSSMLNNKEKNLGKVMREYENLLAKYNAEFVSAREPKEEKKKDDNVDYIINVVTSAVSDKSVADLIENVNSAISKFSSARSKR